MATIMDIQNPWRSLLKTPASWRGVIFYVETGARLSGRRTVVHEYPKRDDPYSEDMGQHAKRFHFSGYLIYRVNLGPGMAPYVAQRQRLVNALEQDGPGELIHPVFCLPGNSITCMCERYTMVENRQRGGFTEFEMQFVELGTPGNMQAQVDTAQVATNSAGNAENAGNAVLSGGAALGIGGIGHA
jgi:prophage DNA circulation protein